MLRCIYPDIGCNRITGCRLSGITGYDNNGMSFCLCDQNVTVIQHGSSCHGDSVHKLLCSIQSGTLIRSIKIARIKACLNATGTYQCTAVCLRFCSDVRKASGLAQFCDHIRSVPLAITDIVILARLQHCCCQSIGHTDLLRSVAIPSFTVPVIRLCGNLSTRLISGLSAG